MAVATTPPSVLCSPFANPAERIPADPTRIPATVGSVTTVRTRAMVKEWRRRGRRHATWTTALLARVLRARRRRGRAAVGGTEPHIANSPDDVRDGFSHSAARGLFLRAARLRRALTGIARRLHTQAEAVRSACDRVAVGLPIGAVGGIANYGAHVLG